MTTTSGTNDVSLKVVADPAAQGGSTRSVPRLAPDPAIPPRACPRPACSSLVTRHLRYDWDDPHSPVNDHLIFSKGHTSPLPTRYSRPPGSSQKKSC